MPTHSLVVSTHTAKFVLSRGPLRNFHPPFGLKPNFASRRLLVSNRLSNSNILKKNAFIRAFRLQFFSISGFLVSVTGSARRRLTPSEPWRISIAGFLLIKHPFSGLDTRRLIALMVCQTRQEKNVQTVFKKRQRRVMTWVT